MATLEAKDRVALERGDLVVPLIEETAHLETREVSTGRVRITTVADLVEEMTAATLDREDVTVERVAVDRVVAVVPATRTENGVTIIPILEERLVVEKQLVLVEELHIRRHTTSETFKVPITIRKQRAIVERLETPTDLNRGEDR